MNNVSVKRIRITIVAGGLATLAACATPPPPPPPPPPPAKAVPLRPVPPGGASFGMAIPPRGPDGLRRTVNYGLTNEQKIWNLRSALNVAALNCRGPQNAGIVPAYSSLLERNKRALLRVNNTVNRQYREQHGRNYRSVFDSYMTRVYNYFALPPTQREFCRTARDVANLSLSVDSASLETFALTHLPRIEQVFDNFYTDYEQYLIDVAAWDAQYGRSTGTVGQNIGPGIRPGALPPAPVGGTNVPPATSDQGTGG